MTEIYHITSAFWPVIVCMAMVIATLAVALYRINQNAKLKQALFREDGSLVYVPSETIHEELNKVYNKIAALDMKLKEVDSLSLKKEKHDDMCAIASYSIKEFIAKKLEQMGTRIEEKIVMLDSKHTMNIENQEKKIESVARNVKIALDRTKHLRSVGEKVSGD